MGLVRAIRLRSTRRSAVSGQATAEQLDELLANPAVFTGTDLAEMLRRDPHAPITQQQWEEILSREYFVMLAASVHGLPQEVLRAMATHPNQMIRDEVYMNGSADEQTRALAVAHGVSPEALDGSVLELRQAGAARVKVAGHSPVSRANEVPR